MLLDPSRRRVLVLGAMRELEGFSRELHEEVGVRLGKMLVEKNISAVLYGVGQDTQSLLEAVQKQRSQVECHFSNSVSEIESQVLAELKKGDIIFVKGSRGIELDRLVKSLHLKAAST
jgi:UDP-N-acetylmuramyl pentapeptide synthase